MSLAMEALPTCRYEPPARGQSSHLGAGLKAGHRVMGGSYTRQFPLVPGDRIETRFGGIWTVVLALRPRAR